MFDLDLMRKIGIRCLEYIAYACLITFIFSSCVSTKQRARNKISRGYKKIQQGLDLAPELVDSINQVRTITLEVPGSSDTIILAAAIDSASFNSVISSYDSALIENYNLKTLLSNESDKLLNTEKVIQRISDSNRRLSVEKDKIISRFFKDTIYTIDNDRLKLTIEIEKGKLKDLIWDVKVQRIDTIIQTQTINLDGRKVRGRFWEDPWFFVVMVGLSILFIVILILVKRATR